MNQTTLETLFDELAKSTTDAKKKISKGECMTKMARLLREVATECEQMEKAKTIYLDETGNQCRLLFKICDTLAQLNATAEAIGMEAYNSNATQGLTKELRALGDELLVTNKIDWTVP